MTANNKKRFSPSVIKALKYYVYIYSHPITEEIFYVGKGKGNRVFAHLEDTKESQKVLYLKELRSQNLAPKIEILIHGLEDEKAALRVESSIIDLIGINNLTNKQNGYKSATYGRMTIEQLNSAYNREKITIDIPAILIRISQAFRYTMSEVELYDYTRGYWRLNPQKALGAKFGFAIYGGIIQEVYEILKWFEAGTTFSVRKNNENIKRKANEGMKDRYEFIGNIAPEAIRQQYKYKSVEHYFKQGNSNPIMYANVV